MNYEELDTHFLKLILERKSSTEEIPGNPHLKISVRGTVEDNNNVELNCSLENDNGYPARSFSWIKYPNLPQSAQKDQSRLSIRRFDNQLDNGLYTCGAWTDFKEFEKTHLVASTEYLLGSNPYFRFAKNFDEDTIIVTCRPGKFKFFKIKYLVKISIILDSASTYKWLAKSDENPYSYRIDGNSLVLFRSQFNNVFTCQLLNDSELGIINIDLEVGRDLLERAFETVNVDVNKIENEQGVTVECQPGENC